MRKALALLASVLLIVSMLPAGIFAEETAPGSSAADAGKNVETAALGIKPDAAGSDADAEDEDAGSGNARKSAESKDVADGGAGKEAPNAFRNNPADANTADADDDDSGAGEDTSATDDWLGSLTFYNGSSADTADQYELTPAFEPDTHEYTLFVPDTEAGVYVYGTSQIATASSYLNSGGTYIRYTDVRGEERDVNASLYYETREPNVLTRVLKRGAEGNELLIYTPDGTKEYKVHVKRITSLMSLKASFGGQETELFRKGQTSYSLNVPKNCAGETLTITPKAYLYTYDDDTPGNPDYDIRVTAGETQQSAETGEPYGVTLSGRSETIVIRVSQGENRETIYRLRVLPTATGGSVRFVTDTEGAEEFSVRLTNENDAEVAADDQDPHRFSGLFVGNTYRYRASFPGYKSVSGTVETNDGETVVTVSFKDKAIGNYLDELKVYPNSSGSPNADYKLTRDSSLDEAFGGTVYTVDYSSEMTSDSFYLAASLSDSAPEGASVRASAYDVNGVLKTVKIPDSEGGTPIRRKPDGKIFDRGADRAVYTVTAGTEDDSEKYIILVKRTLELSNLTVTTMYGEDSILEDSFRRSRHDYQASVMKSEELLFVTPLLYDGSDFDVTVDDCQLDGGSMIVFLTEDHIQRITVALSGEGTYRDPEYQGMTYVSEGVYTVDVERLEPAAVRFDTEPENAVVSVYDRKGERVYSDRGDNHMYSSLYAGRTYSYVVSLYGCVTKVGDFTAVNGGVIRVELDASTAAAQKDVGNVEWWNYRNNEENNGITDASTPDDPEKTTEKWAVMIGGDYNSSCTPPVIAGGYVYTAVGKYIYRLDKDTGEVLAVSEELAGDVIYALNPMTYAEGMLFVQIGKGRVQAVGCDTLRSVWVSEKIGGQTLSPISYKDGYIYTGTWNSETKAGEYFCISVTDEDDTRGTETKYCTWRYSRKGGFYWAGAYATPDFVVFGSDDGEREGNYTDTASIYSVSAKTGDIIEEKNDIEGDIRTSIVYDDGYIYFATKGGVLYRIRMYQDGTFGQVSTLLLGGMATASPTVYNGRVYLGVSGEGGQFSADGGHKFFVIRSDERGLSKIYDVETPGYPQAAALLSTAYESYDYDLSGTGDGRIYIYFTYNAKPGGIAMLTDEPGQESGNVKIVFEPDGNKQEYCISPIATDSDGTLYYKNDSGYLMAVTSNNAYVRDIELIPSAGEAFWEEEFDPGKLKYSVRVDNDASDVAVNLNVPTGRRVTVNGADYVKGMKVPLSDEGETMLEVRVTYQKKTRTYKIKIEKLGSDAKLADLIVGSSNNILMTASHLALSPEFDPDVLEYVTEEYDGDNRFLNVWATPAGKYANVELEAVEGVKKINAFHNAAGSNGKTRYAVYFGDGESEATVDVRVTAGDGSTSMTYRLTLRRTDDFPPNLTNVTADRKSADEGSILFDANEHGKYYYAVTDIDAEQPDIPRTDPVELVKGANRIDLTGLAGEGKKVWIIAEDETGNVSKTPVTALLKPYRVFRQTVTVKPSDAKVVLTDQSGNVVRPASVSGADTPSGGSGGAEGSGADTAGKKASYGFDLVDGNTYRITLEQYGYAEKEDTLTADALAPEKTYELTSIRSADNYLKGLYASSSNKWSAGLLKLDPSFNAEKKRYSATYNGERSYLNVWPVVRDPKAKVKVYAVGGVKASTVNKDETISASTAAGGSNTGAGRRYYKVYFADGMYTAEVRVHVVAEDETARDYFVTLNIRDVTPPKASRVSASRIAKNKASVVFKSSEQGTYYYRIVKHGAKAPLIGTNGKGKPCYEGTTTLTIPKLAAGEWDVYIVVKDLHGNRGNTIRMTIPAWKNGSSSNGGNNGSGQKAKKGAADDGKSSEDGKSSDDVTLKKAGTAADGKSAGLKAAKKGRKKPNDKLKKASKTKKEDDRKTARKEGTDDELDGKSGDDALTGAAGTTGGGDGTGGVGGALRKLGDGALEALRDLGVLLAELAWWKKALLLFAGLGLLYILFFVGSALRRKHVKAALAEAE